MKKTRVPDLCTRQRSRPAPSTVIGTFYGKEYSKATVHFGWTGLCRTIAQQLPPWPIPPRGSEHIHLRLMLHIRAIAESNESTLLVSRVFVAPGSEPFIWRFRRSLANSFGLQLLCSMTSNGSIVGSNRLRRDLTTVLFFHSCYD